MSKTIGKERCPIKTGRSYAFLYPRHNYAGLPDMLEQRQARVIAIRDTMADPLDEITKSINPMLCRSRWLAVCMDLDKGEDRHFYVQSMREIREIDAPIQTNETSRFAVIDYGRIRFESTELSTALAFRLGRGNGRVYGLLSDDVVKTVAPVLPIKD